MEKVLQFNWLNGVFTALPTPFQNGKIDYDSLKKIIQFQKNGGVNGLLLLGSTGERTTLSEEERHEYIHFCMQYKNDFKMIVGIGTSSTNMTVQEAQSISSLGVEAALVVCPYYNKPSQDGLYKHFSMVADVMPTVLYNVPSRTGCNLADETIVRLADHKNIIGIKDSSCDLLRPLRMRRLLNGKPFFQLSGEDGLFSAFLAQGGDGIMSVMSNVKPDFVMQLYQAWRARDFDKMSYYRDYLSELSEILFLESNPVPLKYILSHMGLCSAEVRLPLVSVMESTKKRLDSYCSK